MTCHEHPGRLKPQPVSDVLALHPSGPTFLAPIGKFPGRVTTIFLVALLFVRSFWSDFLPNFPSWSIALLALAHRIVAMDHYCSFLDCVTNWHDAESSTLLAQCPRVRLDDGHQTFRRIEICFEVDRFDFGVIATSVTEVVPFVVTTSRTDFVLNKSISS